MIEILIQQTTTQSGGTFYFGIDALHRRIFICVEQKLRPDYAIEQAIELLQMAARCRIDGHHTNHLYDKDYPSMVDTCLDITKHRKELLGESKDN